MEQQERIYRYKMVLFGDVGVGKTSLVERFVNNKFEESYLSTLGYNVYEKIVQYEEIGVSLMIYDIGGQERFTDLRKMYAKGASTAFIVYDITNAESFRSLGKWKKDLHEFAGMEIPFIIIGNKDDLIDQRAIPEDSAREAAEKLGSIDFFETSAKTGDKVDKAFINLASKTYELHAV
jgi:Ras-related protein Rab-1A